MKFYSDPAPVGLYPDAVERARRFALKVYRTTDYTDAYQFCKDKVKDDHFIGKLGEEAAKHVLSRYAAVTGPDYNIYTGKEKSWDPDLIVNGIGLAVKTQGKTSAGKFGLSWTFQWGDSRKDTILTQPEAWVVFVALDDIHRFSALVFPPFQIKELIFGEPVKPGLKGQKKVVYANSLKF